MEKYRAVSLDDKMANYKLALISGYRNLKTDSFLYPSPEDQHEEMIGVLNKGNEIWSPTNRSKIFLILVYIIKTARKTLLRYHGLERKCAQEDLNL